MSPEETTQGSLPRRTTGTCPPLAYNDLVLAFRETPLFTRRIVEILSDTEYSELQAALVVRPELGKLIPETGGLRKLRWAQSQRGKGKRGGVRIIYYWHREGSLIYMLIAYSKGERDDLSAHEKRQLRKHVAEEFK